MKIAQLYSLFQQGNFAFSTDSRNITPGDIFFALKGENFDGNKYAEIAIEKGAAYSIIDNPVYNTSEKTILTANVLSTFQKLALYHKQHCNFKVIAITGSNGKTTTKELVANVLQQKYKVQYTIGNLNNHIGVPITLLSTNPDTEILVLEMGANHKGEIAELTDIADPDYGLITNIGNAHLEGFGGINGVLKGKTEIFDYLKKHNRIIFFNADNKFLHTRLNYFKNNSVIYAKSNFNLGVVKTETSHVAISMEMSGDTVDFYSRLTGEYNIENILAAIVVGRYFDIPIPKIKKGIENYVPTNKRSQILKTKNNRIIVDCYNANPTSMKAALKNFDNFGCSPKVIILGEMKELGDDSEIYHREILQQAMGLKEIDRIFVTGQMFGFAKGMPKVYYHPETEGLYNELSAQPVTNTTVLLKGSRSNQLEKLIELL